MLIMLKIFSSSTSFFHSPIARARLEAAGHRVTYRDGERPLSADELEPLVAGYDVIIAGLEPYNERILRAALPTVRLVARVGAGYDNVDVAAAQRLGIPVTYTPGANAHAVAEHTLGILLALARQIPAMDRTVKQGRWQKAIGCELYGKTLGIIGAGGIGLEVARRARAFGMKLLATNRSSRPAAALELGIRFVSLEELLRQADVVSLHCNSKRGAPPLIDAQALALMKPSALLVNTARGALVDEAALFAALSSQRIAGAALDVFMHEPPTGSRLLGLDNVILTPHTGASAHEAIERMSDMAVDEIFCLAAARPFINQARS